MANLRGLGSQNRNVDIVISMTEQMVLHGQSFKDAAHYVADKHNITYQTVTKFHCREALRFWNTNEFIEFIESGEIIGRLKRCHPKDVEEIEERLRPLYT